MARNSFKLSMIIDGCYELVTTNLLTYLWFTSVIDLLVVTCANVEVSPEDWETCAQLAENFLASVGDH